MTEEILFPEISPFKEEMLKVSDLHTIFVRQGGNPSGLPVLVVHGGPGGGCSDSDFRFFDPEYYRIIIVDQRGAGQSKPSCEMKDNTLAHLIADFEQIRTKLDITSWLLFGGSWGSTLSLAYAQAHPEHCLGLILRGIWLAREKEISFFFNSIGDFFPERLKELKEHLPAEEHGDLLKSYYTRLMNPDKAVHMPAARAFTKYEVGSAFHDPRDIEETLANEQFVLGLARTECHYMMHHMFLRKNQLIDDLHKIKHLYAELVHGRYDSICPYSGAFELKENWPKALLTTVQGGGHSSSDPEISKALKAATERFKKQH